MVLKQKERNITRKAGDLKHKLISLSHNSNPPPKRLSLYLSLPVIAPWGLVWFSRLTFFSSESPKRNTAYFHHLLWATSLFFGPDFFQIDQPLLFSSVWCTKSLLDLLSIGNFVKTFTYIFITKLLRIHSQAQNFGTKV